MDIRKPLPPLQPVYVLLSEQRRHLSEAPDLYIEFLLGDVESLLKRFPTLPESVEAAILEIRRCAEANDVAGAGKMISRAMKQCRAWEGEDPDIVFPLPFGA